jgi:ATP-dependent DNA helicase RecQ
MNMSSPSRASGHTQAQTPEDVLKATFGYESFRPHQREIIDAVLAGRDVLAVMPTSAGKSICYQVPALIADGVTLVISPLISLMADQVGALAQLGVDAAYLNSSLSAKQRWEVLEWTRLGRLRLLYLAPERLVDDKLLDALRNCGVALVAVDEAHCISQWGNDFRPSYQRISEFMAALGTRPPICALTATATSAVRRDIVGSLGLKDPLRVVASFDRPNLRFELRRPRGAREKMHELLRFVREQGDASGIIYCQSRRAVEEVCEALREARIPATRYHAGLGAAERERNQDDFIYDRARVIVATNAFGMGIDKSDVSFVVHFNLPLSMEAYYQEAGRAGRDGTPATCLLLYSPADIHAAEYLLSQQGAAELNEKQRRDLQAHDLRRLQDMQRYATSTSCLRHQLLAYFGEDSPESCGNCSNCLASWEEVDRTEWALKAVSCVARLAQRNQTLGAGLVCQILRGSREARVLQRGLDTLSTYGIMADVSTRDIRDLLDALVERGILARSEGGYPVLLFTAESRHFLHACSHDGERFVMRERRGAPANASAAQAGRRKRQEADELAATPSAASSTVAGERVEEHPIDEELYDLLKQLRGDLAIEQEVPAYIIFNNRTLEDLCRKRPHTREELLEVSGIGEAKAEHYGRIILNTLRSWEAGDAEARKGLPSLET